jgi:phosphoglycolate phosphatase-like HAD superfamily hydrolase
LSEIIRPIESATSLLLELIRIDVPVAIVTSDSISNTNIYLEKLGLSEHDLTLVCRDTCPHPKRTGYPAIQAADLLNINISDAIVIGDAPMDFEMAINSGSKHLLVSTGQLDHQHLLNSTPNVIKSLSDVTIIS